MMRNTRMNIGNRLFETDSVSVNVKWLTIVCNFTHKIERTSLVGGEPLYYNKNIENYRIVYRKESINHGIYRSNQRKSKDM